MVLFFVCFRQFSGFGRKFLSLPDPLIRGTDSELDPDPSIIKQKSWFLLFCDFFMNLWIEEWCKCTFKKYGNKQKLKYFGILNSTDE